MQQIAKKVLEQEAYALLRASERISVSFDTCVNLVLNLKGRIILTGIGKSAIIAQKICATLNSTGTPALFMHAADAIHGDLGMVQENDAIFCLSKSGNTPEIKAFIPRILEMNVPIIALVGTMDSYLAQVATVVLDASVEHEACPMNLAPTTSTTLALALGDALAVALLVMRQFTAHDFAKFHPGGILGKQLLKISEIYPQNSFPHVLEEALFSEIIIQITSGRIGATAVLNNQHQLKGIITDGDIRRMLGNTVDFQKIRANQFMNTTPNTISTEAFATEAFQQMNEKAISQLIVMKDCLPVGFIHLHDLMREGLV